ncbi:Uncharacterised protein [uncultured archaeon]|nr:Uncharacterised protein [uncultured archaeon]
MSVSYLREGGEMKENGIVKNLKYIITRNFYIYIFESYIDLSILVYMYLKRDIKQSSAKAIYFGCARAIAPFLKNTTSQAYCCFSCL